MDIEKNRDLLMLGNFVGRLLESFPPEIRSKAVEDIEEAEQYYCGCAPEFAELRTVLAPQLRTIELSRRVPILNRDPRLKRRNIMQSYGDAIESYLASIPPELREDMLKDFCGIVSYHGWSINSDNSNPCKYFLNILDIFESLI